jgi:ribose transport system substrate-binding protein
MWGAFPFLQTVLAGHRAEAEKWESEGKAKVVEMFVTDAGMEDPSIQATDMEDLFARNLDGLIVFPGDSDIAGEVIVNLYNKNDIPVVITDIGVSKGEIMGFSITSQEELGAYGAEVTADYLPKGSKVIVFNGAPEARSAMVRQENYEKRAKELGLTVIPAKNIKPTVESARAATEDVLTSIPDIAAIFHFNPTPAMGSVLGIEAAAHSAKVVTTEIDNVSLERLQDGTILIGCIIQDPYHMGEVGMRQMLSYLTGVTDYEDDVLLHPMKVTKDNVLDWLEKPQLKLQLSP